MYYCTCIISKKNIHGLKPTLSSVASIQSLTKQDHDLWLLWCQRYFILFYFDFILFLSYHFLLLFFMMNTFLIFTVYFNILIFKKWYSLSFTFTQLMLQTYYFYDLLVQFIFWLSLSGKFISVLFLSFISAFMRISMNGTLFMSCKFECSVDYTFYGNS